MLETNKKSVVEIQDFIVEQLTQHLQLSANEIDIDLSFTDYGVDSILAVKISEQISDFLKIDLPVTLLWNFPSISKAALGCYRLVNGHSKTQHLFDSDNAASTSHQPIAVIGMSCRFPGADSLPAFWRMLIASEEGIKARSPQQRLNRSVLNYPGGYLDSVDLFDREFFHLSEEESRKMDPQQRLLLEVTLEALMDAGQNIFELRGRSIGVFIGISNQEYDFGKSYMEGRNIYDITGRSLSIAANRISYFLDICGPSIALDSACSSSLSAVHFACQSLRNKECDMAIVGGANLLLDPQVFTALSTAGILSSSGHCKTFDREADGYVRSEGVGVVLLRPFNTALSSHDRIYSVILGSAMNQDGRTNGLTAPNGQAQTAVIRSACRQAQIKPSQLHYVELHGTGTQIGDPIEAHALSSLLMEYGKSRDDPCLVGSVKSNIGHLEAAAGIASLIKVSLALYHRKIPASLHFNQINPQIPIQQLPIQIQGHLLDFQLLDNPPANLFSGISAFSFGGTNVHVITQSPPVTSSQSAEQCKKTVELITLSAANPAALTAMSKTYLSDISHNPAYSLQTLAYNTALRNTHYPCRLAMTVENFAQLKECLNDSIEGRTNPDLITSPKINKQPKLTFAFPGQSKLDFDKIVELFDESVFYDSMTQFDAIFKKISSWSIVDLLKTKPGDINQNNTEIIQPVTLAIEIALTELWASWGVIPDSVVGHSMGEIAAAYAAKAISLEDAVRLIYHRSQLLQHPCSEGKMLMVQAASQDLQSNVQSEVHHFSIAAFNSPRWQVLSVQTANLADLIGVLNEKKILYRELPGNYAFHGPWLQPLAAQLSSKIIIRPSYSSIAFYSTVKATLLPGDQLDLHYWMDNITSPVRFEQAINCILVDEPNNLFLEVSPFGILKSIINDVCKNDFAKPPVLVSVYPQEKPLTQMKRSLGKLYTLNFPVHWLGLFKQVMPHISLPLYPWQRQRYWIDSQISIEKAASTTQPAPEIQTDAITRQLIDILKPLLNGADTLEIKTHFIAAGMNSLIAAQYILRLNNFFNLSLTFRNIFENPNIEKLGQLIKNQIQAKELDRVSTI